MNLMQMSSSGAVLILAVTLIRATAVNRLPKKTFLILWDIVLLRLLLPFSIPSIFSIYTFTSQHTQKKAFTQAVTDGMLFRISSQPAAGTQRTQPMPHPPLQDIPYGIQVSGWSMAWATGMVICAMFFVICYVRCLREFRASLPVEHAFVKHWLREHPSRRPVSVRQSDRILAPLTYGVFRPVILLSKKTDFEDLEQLRYILLHEYVHIRRLDSLAKLVCAAALCIHWFNPFVWAMYLLYQRDIELSCDESVVRRMGVTSKSEYAWMLINMEAKKSGFLPFSNHFSKNALEERIIAIMKTRKTSRVAVLAAAALITSVATIFVTSADDGTKTADSDAGVPSATAGLTAGNQAKSATGLTAGNQATGATGDNGREKDTGFSEKEYEKLLALQFDGYEDMPVAKYREKVLAMTDTREYQDLLDRFFQDEALYGLQDSNETASFLYHILSPILLGPGRNWSFRFGGSTEAFHPKAIDNALLEFSFTLTVQDAKQLTVREYNAARLAMMDGMDGILKSRTVSELQDGASIKSDARRTFRQLAKAKSSGKLKVTATGLDYHPMYLEPEQAEVPDAAYEETRDYPYATQEDYRSLLALKTPSYQEMPVADFNDALLEWGNADFARAMRIEEDCKWKDFAVSLTEEEKLFVAHTVGVSSAENYEYIKSFNTGKPKEDPVIFVNLQDKEAPAQGSGYGNAWCRLECCFSYHISDEKKVTVGERDQCVGGLRSSVEAFWKNTGIEKLLATEEKEIMKKLKDMAKEYSTSQITVKILKSHTRFQRMDDRIYD